MVDIHTRSLFVKNSELLREADDGAISILD